MVITPPPWTLPRFRTSLGGAGLGDGRGLRVSTAQDLSDEKRFHCLGAVCASLGQSQSQLPEVIKT